MYGKTRDGTSTFLIRRADYFWLAFSFLLMLGVLTLRPMYDGLADSDSVKPLQLHDLIDRVCLYDKQRAGLWNSIQQFVYGSSPSHQDCLLKTNGEGATFTRTDVRDHLASPFIPLIPSHSQTQRVLAASFTLPDGCAE